jgi:hypothetical protein
VGKWSGSKAVWVVVGGVLPIVALTVIGWSLAGVGGPDVDELARSAKASKRVQSVGLLRNRAGEEAGDKLLRLSADKDTGVAVAAVWALGERRRPEDRAALEKVLNDTKLNVRVRAEAATGLGLFKQTDPNTLVQALQSEKDPRVRVGAAKGLMALRNLRTVPALVMGLEDPDERVRRWSIAALHKMMVRRFPYDPKQAPETQRTVIAEIQHYTRHSAEADVGHIVAGGQEGQKH